MRFCYAVYRFAPFASSGIFMSPLSFFQVNSLTRWIHLRKSVLFSSEMFHEIHGFHESDSSWLGMFCSEWV